MKKISKYIYVALVSVLITSCTPQKENTSIIVDVISKLTFHDVANTQISYGTVYDIDSNEYKTLQIGKYEWFAQNLRTKKLQDGTPIPIISENETWANTKEPACCSYNNNECTEVTGMLYNYKTVQTNQICPEGWEVASDSAWIDLANNLGGVDKAGVSLKANNVWNEKQKTTNESGFSAVPAGFREREGAYYIMGKNAIWWSADAHNNENAKYFYIDNNESLNESHIVREVGLSIRCVKKQ